MNRKKNAMYREYGICHDHKCKDCCNLAAHKANKVWYKCKAYGESKSEATDWAKGNTACGLFNISVGSRMPLIEKLKHEQKNTEDEPIPGQIEMFGE